MCLFDPPIIAVVDDDEALREALSDLLQVMGLPYRSFDRAEAFLAAYSPGIFGCVITDVRMPGISGLELLERLKAMDSAMPVIVVTSHTDPMIRSRALGGGAHAYLTKPVTDHALLEQLNAIECYADFGCEEFGCEELAGKDQAKGQPDD
jgi:two-component system, LuxR family, response regulator FixJ